MVLRVAPNVRSTGGVPACQCFDVFTGSTVILQTVSDRKVKELSDKRKSTLEPVFTRVESFLLPHLFTLS